MLALIPSKQRFLFIRMFDCQREDELRVGHDLMFCVVFLGGERRERLQRRPGNLLFFHYSGLAEA